MRGIRKSYSSIADWYDHLSPLLSSESYHESNIHKNLFTSYNSSSSSTSTSSLSSGSVFHSSIPSHLSFFTVLRDLNFTDNMSRSPFGSSTLVQISTKFPSRLLLKKLRTMYLISLRKQLTWYEISQRYRYLRGFF
jgi:hypothetical protein